jgi:heat shock protein HslJ
MTSRRRTWIWTLAIVTLALAGCAAARANTGGPGGDGTGTGATGALNGRTFLSTAVTDDGAPRRLVPGTRVRLTFTGDGVTAQAGCNTMSGSARLDGGRLVVPDSLAMTEMGCPPGLAEQDQWLAALLAAGPRVSLDGDRLVLTHGGTAVRLLDRTVAEPDKPLVGTAWTLDGVTHGQTVSSVPMGVTSTLRIAPSGRMSLDLGCPTATARADVRGNRLVVTDVTVTAVTCASPGPPPVGDDVLAVLKGTVRWTIEGDLLHLTRGTRGLTYRADVPVE